MKYTTDYEHYCAGEPFMTQCTCGTVYPIASQGLCPECHSHSPEPCSMGKFTLHELMEHVQDTDDLYCLILEVCRLGDRKGISSEKAIAEAYCLPIPF
nr:hypothetical protein [Anaerolineae bacterium]